MFVKVNDSVINQDTTTKNILNYTTAQQNSNSDSNGTYTYDRDLTTVTISENGVYMFSIDKTSGVSSSWGATATVQLVSQTTGNVTSYVSKRQSEDKGVKTANAYVEKDTYTLRLHFVVTNSNAGNGFITVKPIMIDLVWYRLFKNFWLIVLPKQVANIWEFTTVVLFWEKDRAFYLGREVTTATTGAIAPWNFVGYLQIWDYKIPYYK